MLSHVSDTRLRAELDRRAASFAAPAADPRAIYRWCEQWSATLCSLRKGFDGDLDFYLLLLVFLQSEMARGLRTPTLPGGDLRETGPRGLNALSISQICSVPRETTRRKLGRLVEKGYLTLDQDGLFYLTDRYRPADAVKDIGVLMDFAR
ncbi:MAG: hypothetical protein J0I28_05515 [Caulobacterales bacterium]|nr:hypothetical protein [Caulobacterales bacterium]